MSQTRYAEVNTETNIVRNVFWSDPETLVQLPGHRYVTLLTESPVGVDYIYDQLSGGFSPPVYPPEPVTRAEFIRRLGPENLFAIKTAAQRTDEVGMRVDYFIELTRLADFIDPVEAKPSLLEMETMGVLPEGTADQVFPD